MVKKHCINSNQGEAGATAECCRIDQEECDSVTLQQQFSIEKEIGAYSDFSASSLSDNSIHQNNTKNYNNNTSANQSSSEPRSSSMAAQEASPSSLSSNYQIEERSSLGAGSNARVIVGQDLINNRSCAIKQIFTEMFAKAQHSPQETLINKTYFSIIQNEANIMKEVQTTINSDYFVKLYDASLNINSPVQNLYMELCPQGTLEQHYMRLNPAQAIYIFQQVTQGVKLLRNKRIIHRDLKLSNIFFKDQRVKIGDFGFAIQFPENTDKLKTRYLGTALFDAPEIVLKKQEFYTLDNDIFSLGVILHLLFFKKFPYMENNDLRQRLEKGERVSIEHSNHLIDDLLNKMLSINPDDRITWDQLMNHPVITMSAQQQLKLAEIYSFLENSQNLPQQVQQMLQSEYYKIQKKFPYFSAGAHQSEINNTQPLFRQLSAEEIRLINSKSEKVVPPKTINLKNKKNMCLKTQQLQNSRNNRLFYCKQENMRQVLRNNQIQQMLEEQRNMHYNQ